MPDNLSKHDNLCKPNNIGKHDKFCKPDKFSKHVTINAEPLYIENHLKTDKNLVTEHVIELFMNKHVTINVNKKCELLYIESGLTNNVDGCYWPPKVIVSGLTLDNFQRLFF